LRGDLRELAQFAENVSIARATNDLGAASLQDASATMQSARELLMRASNGTVADNDLAGLGQQVGQLLEQLLGIANTSRAGRHLFAGTATDAPPFRLEEGPGGTRIRYAGNGEVAKLRVAPGVETEWSVPGDAIFLRRQRGPTEFRGGGTGARPSGALDSGVGFGELRVGFAGLSGAPPQITAGNGTTDALGSLTWSVSGGTLSIGGGPSVPIPATNQDFTTADGRVINLTVSGTPTPASGTFVSLASLSIDSGTSTTTVDFSRDAVQVFDARDGTVLHVDVTQLARAGTEAVTYHGTFDAFTLLIELRDTLLAAPSTDPATTSARLQALLAEVESAHGGILDGLAAFGGRSEQMTALTTRLDNLELSARESLSDAEDADLTESILKMNQQQLVYQASLAVSARIVQTTLLDYLT
ncbi:MAG TPA: flagellin, partial [Planctomycetota bacterium]|nr:flagellin [Planctomycetota bacterium]